MIGKEGDLVVHAVKLQHRPAMGGLQLVSGKLTKRGSVQLQPATNTLVIRDTSAALAQILNALRDYDRPSRPLTLDIVMVWATRSGVGPSQSDLPEILTKRLRALLPYDNFQTQAETRLYSREGETITYTLGQYKVSFRLGAMVEEAEKLVGEEKKRVVVPVSDFRVYRHERRIGGSRAATNLIVPLGQTTSWVVARHESSTEALMVVLTLRQGGQLVPLRK